MPIVNRGLLTGSDPNSLGPGGMAMGSARALLNPSVIAKILEYLSGRGASVPGSQLGANALGEMAGQGGGFLSKMGPGAGADMEMLELIQNMFKTNPFGARQGAQTMGMGIGRTGAPIDESLIKNLVQSQAGRTPFYNMQ